MAAVGPPVEWAYEWGPSCGLEHHPPRGKGYRPPARDTPHQGGGGAPLHHPLRIKKGPAHEMVIVDPPGELDLSGQRWTDPNKGLKDLFQPHSFDYVSRLVPIFLPFYIGSGPEFSFPFSVMVPF